MTPEQIAAIRKIAGSTIDLSDIDRYLEASGLVVLTVAERDQLRAELRQAHEALTLLRSRLPQLGLDDHADWQRGVIDGALGPGSGVGGEGGEA